MPSVKQIEIDGVTYDLGGSCGFSDDAKNALIALLENVAYVGTDGQQYLTDLYNKMFDNYWSITNTLSNASNSNSAQTVEKGSSYSATISANAGYTLTGATVSVTMNGADVTASVYNNGTISIAEVTGDVVITVVAVALTVVSISAVYTQSGTVYDTDSLDSLKADLIVTATMNDSSTAVVPSTDYTLSGSLTTGTSTITVTFSGETTTFNVTVTHQYVIGSNLFPFASKVYISSSSKCTANFTDDENFTFSCNNSPTYAAINFANNTTYLQTILTNGKKYAWHMKIEKLSGSRMAILPALRKSDGSSAISAADLGVSWTTSDGEVTGEWTQNSDIAYPMIYVNNNDGTLTCSVKITECWIKEVNE